MPNTTNPSAPLYGDYRDFSKGGRYGPTGAEAPKQTGKQGGRAQFDYWETNPDKVNAYLQANAGDPALQAAAQQGSAALDAFLHERGYRVPAAFKADVGPDGQPMVKEKSWWDKHKHWALPAIGMGGAIAAPAVLGALGGGGGSAASAGGVGIGETGAVSGLGGSGFGGVAAGGGAAAGAGGARGAILKGLGMAGRVASGAAQGRHNQRMDQTMANQAQDRTGLAAAQLNLQAPGMRATNAVRGDILGGAQDVSFGGPLTGTGGRKPTITGGLRPSLMSADTRSLGKQMSRDAMLSQLQGPAFTPSAQPMPSGVDKALGAVGTTGAILDTLGESGLLKRIPKIGGWF